MTTINKTTFTKLTSKLDSLRSEIKALNTKAAAICDQLLGIELEVDDIALEFCAPAFDQPVDIKKYGLKELADITYLLQYENDWLKDLTETIDSYLEDIHYHLEDIRSDLLITYTPPSRADYIGDKYA